MRALMLVGLFLVGCGGTEPIVEQTSALGCWNSLSSHEELDLRADGSMQHLDGDNASITAGTWNMQGSALELHDGGSVQFWQVTAVSPAEMWTDSGVVKHWQSVACH
jgi:hypothetical protein